MAKHEIGGGEYVTIDGITYSIAPQGPGKPIYHDKAHPLPGAYVGQWRRPTTDLGNGCTRPAAMIK
jgi:hypothetical protein